MFNDSAHMAMTVHGDDGFRMDDSIRRYIEDKRQRDPHNLGSQFYDAILERHDVIMNSDAMRTAKSIHRRIINSIKNTIDDGYIRLDDIGRMQNPPPTMYRYLMAEPTTRRLFYKDRIEGYREDYNDPYGSDVNGEQLPEYRHVMNGVFVKEEEVLTATRYIEPSETASHLSLDEQFDIFYSWNNVKCQLETGSDDPTSKYNSAL